MPSSPKVKKSNRRTEGQKYSSKFTAGVIDNLVQKHLENVTRNVNTTEKWAMKMKASLLRKISACSKVAFLDEAQRPEALQDLIEKEQEKISAQTAKIKEIVAKTIKHNKLTEVQVLEPVPRAFPAGRFDDNISDISRSLATVAHQVNSAGSSLDSRVKSLRETLAEVQNNWVKPSSPKSSSGTAALQRSVTSPGKNAGALGKLHEHLEKA